MSDQWGTRDYVPDQQPSIRTRRERVPETANAQQAYGALATIALTTAALLCYFDRQGAIDVGRGVYAILAVLAAIGGHGWTICRAETRVRRDLGGKVAELTTLLSDLRDEVARQGVAHLWPPQKQQGVTYLPTAVGGQSGPAPAGPPKRVGLDPETIAAARSLAKDIHAARSVARRLLDGPTDEIPVRRDPE